MGKITELLNAVDVYKENTDNLYGIFKQVNDYDLPVVRFIFYPGAGLIRQRINKKGEEYTHISDLNYPPVYCLTGYERANLPYQPMFYACSFPSEYKDDNVPPPRVIALQETSSFFRAKNESGIERCTVSRWEVVKEIELIALPFMAEYKMACSDILNMQEGWNRALENSVVNPDGKELIEYMADEIGKPFNNNVEYFKIANFVNYLLNVNEKTKNADGIIYPSVPAAGSGFNVAIRPSVVDEKVKFVGASLCHLLKRKDKSYLCVMNETDSVNGNAITFKKKIFDDEEAKVYKSYAAGLAFRN